MVVLSVDLGTSNTVAVLSAHGRQPRVVEVDGSATMPSAVFADEEGKIVVGRDAERRARLDPARFEPNPKRRIDEGTLLLGDAVVPVSEALAAVLRRVQEETSRQLGGGKPDEVRLTHPAQWGPVRRNVLLSAARIAGMGANLVLVPEPVAAAAHFASFPGRTLAAGQALAVYDLGAGTFDVAIVGVTQTGFAVLAEAGLPDLGGLDVDQSLLQHVGQQVSSQDPHGWQRLLMPQSTADRRAQRALREDVKVGKETLSRHPQTEVPLPEPFHDVLVTRIELEGLIRPNLLRSVELLAGTVHAAGLSPDRLAGIYLVGGSSRIPLVATLIAEQLRVVPTNLDQPETAVALGAHHVPHASLSPRTENIAGAIATQEAAHASPPPPPLAHAMAQPAPAPMAPMPVVPPPVMHQPPPMAPQWAPPPKKNSTLPWVIGGVALLVVTVLVTVLMVANGGSGDVANPKQLTEDADCEPLLSEDEATDALGEQVRRDEDPEISGCDFETGSADDLDNRAFRIAVQGSTGGGSDQEIEFEGYPAYEKDEAGQCVLIVKVADDDVYVLVQLLSFDSTKQCTDARALMKKILANLPAA